MKFLFLSPIFRYSLFLSFFFFYSCSDDSVAGEDLIEEGTILATPILDTCLCDILTLDSLGVFYDGDKLYTGVCIYNYPTNGSMYMAKSVLEGKLHGNVTYYDKFGDVLLMETYENGVKKNTGDGAPITCDCSDLEQKKIPGEPILRTFLDAIPFTGKCTKKYPDSDVLYLEAGYTKGLHDGFSIYYDKFGNTMYMEKYEMGELIKVIHDE